MRYRGKKPRGGISAEQAIAVVILLMVATLVMTMRVSAEITGMSAGEQLHQALFVAKDWE